MTISKRRTAIATGVALLLVGGGTAAYAYWTAGGSGSGAGTAGTTAALTVNQTSTVAGLYPGGPAGTLSGNFDNPNSGAIYVASVTAVVSSVTNGTSDATKPACVAGDFVIGGSAPVGAEVPAGAAKGSWTGLTLALTDAATNQDNCKLATAVITYTAS